MGKIITKEDETIEMVLSDDQINELIDKLKMIKDDKTHLHISVDNKNQILIHHESDELL